MISAFLLCNCAIRYLQRLVNNRERLAHLCFGDAKRWIGEERIPAHECVKSILTEKLAEFLHLGRGAIEGRHRLQCFVVSNQLDNSKQSDVARRAYRGVPSLQ